jgi:hypothetical protein
LFGATSVSAFLSRGFLYRAQGNDNAQRNPAVLKLRAGLKLRRRQVSTPARSASEGIGYGIAGRPSLALRAGVPHANSQRLLGRAISKSGSVVVDGSPSSSRLDFICTTEVQRHGENQQAEER